MVRSTAPPDGALTAVTEVVGRPLAGAVRRGEVLTDSRVVGADGPDPGPGRVAIAVRPADPAIVQLLQPGLAVAVMVLSETGTALTLTDDGVVLAVLESADRSPDSRPVLLSVPAADADRVTVGTLSGDIALLLR